MVGLSLAEICSAFPTSGGLYVWTTRLCSARWAPIASWTVGYTNWLGLVSEWDGPEWGLSVLCLFLFETGRLFLMGGCTPESHIFFIFEFGLISLALWENLGFSPLHAANERRGLTMHILADTLRRSWGVQRKKMRRGVWCAPLWRMSARFESLCRYCCGLSLIWMCINLVSVCGVLFCPLDSHNNQERNQIGPTSTDLQRLFFSFAPLSRVLSFILFLLSRNQLGSTQNSVVSIPTGTGTRDAWSHDPKRYGRRKRFLQTEKHLSWPSPLLSFQWTEPQ